MVDLSAKLIADGSGKVVAINGSGRAPAAATPEAVLAKGFDKLETILQHTQGANAPDFDYRFNLAYGKARTDAHPLLAEIRALIDAETEALADGRKAWTG